MNSKNRAMALLLSVFMTMTYMPSFAFADTAESSDTTSTTESQTGENQNDSAQTESSENGQEEASQAESKSASPQADTEENAGEAENNKTEESVAAIGETGYATLAEAIEAAKSGDTITLKKDVAEDVTIPADADITLNTAKHTLTNAKEHTITVAYGGKLTVVGGGTIDNITNGRTPLYNKGTTVLKDVTVIRSKTKSADPDKNSYYSILNRGEMTIDGATVKAENDNFSSLVENGYFNYKNEYKEGTSAKNPKLHIKNGTFSGGLNTIKNDDGGEVVIDDGTFTNIAQAVVMNWNVATINGGTYETELAGIHNGKYDDSIDKGELTINGGIFKTKNLVCNTFKDSQIGTVTVKGGDFTAVEKMYGGSKNNDETKAEAAKTGIQVSGGTYKSKDVIADYVAEGFAPAENEDGTIGVEDPTIVATVGDNTYKTLAEAIKAAKSGDTIKLKKDVTEDVTIPADKDITLDTAKHTLTNVKNDTITVTKGGKLTVIGGGIIDNITNGKASVSNNGTVLLKDVTIIRSKTKSDNPNKNSYYSILNHGEMTIDGATVKAENDNFSSLVENGYFDYASGYKEGTNAKNPKLHIKSGTFNGGLNTIKNDDGGEVVIDGGSFTNIAQVAVMNWNKATINGGTFEGKQANFFNGKYDDVVDNGELTINGGTFKSTTLVTNSQDGSTIGSVSVKGGDFTAVDKMYEGNKKADTVKAGIQVTGGTYKSKDVVAVYTKDGYAPTEKEDGTVGIGTDDAYIDNLKKTNEKLQNDFNDAVEKKNQLQAQYETLDKQLTETKNKLDEANQEIGRQKGLVEAAQKNVNTAKEELEAKEKEVSKLQSEKDTVDGQLKEALEELKDAKDRLGEAQKTLGEKEKELSDSQTKVNDMQQQLNDMQTALNDTQSKLDTANSALDVAKAEIAKKDADLDTVQKKLDEANSAMTKLSKDLEESQSALTEAEKVLKAKDEIIDSVQKELATTQAELKASQDELQATKDKLAATSKELEKKNAELDAAQKELADAKAALEKANKTIAQMKIKNPAKVTGLKVKAGKKKVSVSYKKVASAQGYTLMISKSKKFSKAKKYGTKTITIKQGKTVKKTVTKLSSKKTYYVKVRAWKKVNGKTYTGSWSAVKKIKVK